MQQWHGYCLIEIATPLTTQQKQDVKTALMQLGKQAGEAFEITQFRPSLDKQAAILEITLDTPVTKAQVCNKLAELLPYTAQQISNNMTFTLSPGNTWWERAQATCNYLVANSAAWEEAI